MQSVKKNFVYVIAGPGGVQPWKIGRTEDPTRRLSQIQTSHFQRLEFVKVAEAHPDLENSLHEQFARHRVSGEWFNLPLDAQTALLARLNGAPWVRQLPTTTKSQQRPWTKGRTKYRPQKRGTKVEGRSPPVRPGRPVLDAEFRTDRPAITSSRKPPNPHGR